MAGSDMTKEGVMKDKGDGFDLHGSRFPNQVSDSASEWLERDPDTPVYCDSERSICYRSNCIRGSEQNG